jgi:hypothetical protein
MRNDAMLRFTAIPSRHAGTPCRHLFDAAVPDTGSSDSRSGTGSALKLQTSALPIRIRGFTGDLQREIEKESHP